MSDSFVYFVQCGDDGPIKIGKSSGDMKRRLGELQVGNPVELRLLVSIPGDVEQAMHMRFARQRIRGEWFRPDPVLLAFVAGVAWGAKGGVAPVAAVMLADAGTNAAEMKSELDWHRDAEKLDGATSKERVVAALVKGQALLEEDRRQAAIIEEYGRRIDGMSVDEFLASPLPGESTFEEFVSH